MEQEGSDGVVPVYDMLLMAVIEGAGQLGDILSGLPVREPTLLLQLLEQFALARVLEYQVDAGGIVEVPE
jgi:hypothetical protein